MNYDAFMEPLSWFLTGMEKHSDEYRSDLIGNAEIFFESMRENMLKLTTPSLYISMNQLSNHDHSRFLTRTKHRVGRTATVGAESANYGVKPALMRAAVAVQMTWPGAPTLYYGDEVGLCGWTDPDNRRTFPWGHEDLMMLSFHKELIRIHKDYDSLRTGSFIELFAGQGVIVYGRFMEDEFFIIVINSGEIYKEIQIPVWIMGMLDNQRVVTMIQSTESSFSLHATMKVVHDGHIMVELLFGV